MRWLPFVLLVACNSGNVGDACGADRACSGDLVCASTSSPALRRCFTRCADTWDGGVALGQLCGDGSVCIDSDQGPVCYFAGFIPLGDACPAASCDPAARVCDCEPGTICSGGFCRQVCAVPPPEPRDASFDADLPPDAPEIDAGGDTGTVPDRICGPLAICTAGVCIPIGG